MLLINFFVSNFSGNIGNGDVTCDGYHKYKVLSLFCFTLSLWLLLHYIVYSSSLTSL